MEFINLTKQVDPKRFEVTPRILDRLRAYFEALLFFPRSRRHVFEA